MSNPLFSFGTSRGGTTFFARILSVNPQVKVASDPFLPLFRTLRNEVITQKVDAAFDTNQPLEDYYFTESKLQRMKAVQSSSMDIKLNNSNLSKIQAQLESRMNLAAKELAARAKEIKGNTVLELFNSSIALMEDVYESKESLWCGSNDNWVVEFLPVLARAYSRAKFIIMVRDPRGAMASSMKVAEKDPELVPLMYSFAQNWRKHAAFTWKLMQDAQLRKRLYVQRYEDFVRAPEESTVKICEFLGVPFSQDMLIPKNFRPISGKEWTTYSNFDVPENVIYADSADKWKKYLEKRRIEFIEFVCDQEMKLFGYQPIEYDGGEISKEAMEYILEDDQTSLGWRGKHDTWNQEIAYHYRKRALIEGNDDNISALEKEKYFLFEEVFEGCRNLQTKIFEEAKH